MAFLFWSLALLSIVLNVWQWIAARRFPMHKHLEEPRFTPALSVLKPLKGCDAETERCLESWFTQKYPVEYQLLFGVASASDPVCEIVNRLKREYPHRECDLIICDPILGPNAKVSSLCYLSKRARFEHIVVSDADVLIEPEFFLNLVAALHENSVGLVNSFYIMANPGNLPMRIEAVAVNADFWSQVLQGNMLKRMDFALGAVMATGKTHLNRIGGFEALLEYLADDYELGNRIARTGAKVELCLVPVECRSEQQGWQQVWSHQVRWARTIRVCQPVPYFLSILSNATLWPLLALISGTEGGGKLFVAAGMLRIVTAAMNYKKLTGQLGFAALLAPAKDLVQAAIWAVSFIGREITWRGERFRVHASGKLTPLA
jgi:ceramide glucosyltransferase